MPPPGEVLDVMISGGKAEMLHLTALHHPTLEIARLSRLQGEA